MDGPCNEPEGNKVINDTWPDIIYAHDVMLSETGQCPWCGDQTG